MANEPKCPNCAELELALEMVSREVARLHDLRTAPIETKREGVIVERGAGNVVQLSFRKPSRDPWPPSVGGPPVRGGGMSPVKVTITTKDAERYRAKVLAAELGQEVRSLTGLILAMDRMASLGRPLNPGQQEYLDEIKVEAKDRGERLMKMASETAFRRLI